MQDAAFDDLVAGFYEAATRPGAWPQALQRLAHALPLQAVPVVQLHGWDKASQRAAFCYRSTYSSDNHGLKGPGPDTAPSAGQLAWNEGADWTSLTLHDDPRWQVSLQLWRPDAVGPRPAPGAAVPQPLCATCGHAVALSLAYAQAEGPARVGQEILQHMPSAAVLLDESRRLLFRNHRAEQLLRKHPLLCDEDGLLRCADARG